MIKFFRHIRQSLIMENKTSKYLKYAIGEIVLVVIGILIALQINNWNEQRKESSRETKLKSELIEEFEKDLTQLESKIKIRNRIIKSNLKLLSYIDDENIQDADSIKHYMAFTSFRPTFDPISIEIIDKSDIGIIKNDTLRRLLTAWKIEVMQLREDETNWRNYVIEHKYAYELYTAPGLARSLQIEFWKDKSSSLFLLESDAVKRIELKASNTKIKYVEILKSPFWETYCTRAIQLNTDANLNSQVLKQRMLQIINLLNK